MHGQERAAAIAAGELGAVIEGHVQHRRALGREGRHRRRIFAVGHGRLAVAAIFRRGQADLPHAVIIGIGPAHVGALVMRNISSAMASSWAGGHQLGPALVGAVAAMPGAVKAVVNAPVHRALIADAGGEMLAIGLASARACCRKSARRRRAFP